MCNKTINKKRKHFCQYVLQCFSSDRVLIEHKEICLKINGKQNLKLKSSSLKFKNHFKQLAVLFKIYVDFESLLIRVSSSDRNNDTLSTEKYQDHVPCRFAYKVVWINDRFSTSVVLYRRKNTVNKFIEATSEETNYCKKIKKKHFDKNLVLSAEDEQRLQSSNKC